MNHLINNLTFAVIFDDVGWRTDLTMRYTEYMSNKINDDFLEKIIYPASVDEALSMCKTDYLIVQTSGNIIFDVDIFEKLDSIIDAKSDIAIGFVKLEHDYITFDSKCIFFNMILWRESQIPFNSSIRQGPRFTCDGFNINNKLPFTVTIADGDEVYVANDASSQGAGIIIQQLRNFSTITSFEKIAGKKDLFFLSTESAYEEIHTETIFEKTFLEENKNRIFLHYEDTDVDCSPVDVIVCPADGMRASDLLNTFKPSELIIYDNSSASLDFQKHLFSFAQTELYGVIAESFSHKEKFCEDIAEEKHSCVISASPSTVVKFANVNAVTFEMEELIKSIDRDKSLLIDFSDIFVYPHNFYRRPLFQIEAMFAELYSLLKSRTGPTRIVGFAPGFKLMNNIDINTSTAQFDADPTFNPVKINDEGEEEVIPHDPIMWTPTTSEKIQDETITQSWTSSLKNAVSVPIVRIKEIIKHVVVEKIVEVPREVIVERVVEKIVEVPREVRVREEPKPIHVTTNSSDLMQIAAEHGYVKAQSGDSVIFSKSQRYTEIDAIFEYSLNLKTNSWTFKLGKVGAEKRIEFSNGQMIDGLIKHLRTENKVNPKTAAKYFP